MQDLQNIMYKKAAHVSTKCIERERMNKRTESAAKRSETEKGVGVQGGRQKLKGTK